MDIEDDEAPPQRGDRLTSVGKKGPGTTYFVIRSRKVKRRDPTARPRYNMMVETLQVLEARDSILLRPRAPFKHWSFVWYPRKKRKLSFEDLMQRCPSPNNS